MGAIQVGVTDFWGGQFPHTAPPWIHHCSKLTMVTFVVTQYYFLLYWAKMWFDKS